uniref:Uncharacterized protein n=1 Tax=Kalanchoe fedtschenkoi TaxID=63787 RepID=A0A7N0VEB6_KALFE
MAYMLECSHAELALSALPIASNISAASFRTLRAISGFEMRFRSATDLSPAALANFSQYSSPARSKHIVAIT